MSIFGDIVNKLFGKAKPEEAPPADVQPAPEAAAAAALPLADVDVAALMDQLVSDSGQNLNWRMSIVDTMKALGMDSSLDHRKALARELAYTGSMDDSAAMNIWLHGQVMRALAANGGKLPPELTQG
ncbi:DUF3597 domain-containing protein [Trinickia caryophylli]|uniref:DUF3597 domain-containing protein n=1 Tax=Trinickia caryophylli TaxID=28094 RepID=A0A1X7FA10_TRICW|nr:DUF3597 domain-containing protein [Trinickia caryophylli]PMS08812.1 DUF3597 domain-containing protein [Trinickia caryophylli]TRX20315.1 DUF3597 domain-containing protein [Trinickia caryophylli]WQE13686.1 DUF3597 domain-containing protein [Trinickia caryophylli]SMF48303.1 protein of unknown function [Trinickia caryophylli]GLU34316.1 hypothetical protein Busp01_41580 [Trinickia caryophylli]